MGTEAVSVAPLALTFVGPGDTKGAWPFVRKGLEIVKAKTNAEWIPEDVYVHIRSGSASLFVATRWKRPVGFVIVTMTVNPFTGDKTAILWVCYTNERGVVDELLPQVEAMAWDAGCAVVSFQSPRRAWKRRLAGQGYELREYVFEKRLG